MLLKSIAQVQSFVAGDKTIIQEWLHPKNDQVNVPYSIAFASIEPGMASLPHVLRHSIEVYIIQEGSGIAYIDGAQHVVQAGDLVLIPAGAVQHIENTGTETLRFLCLVSPPWQQEEELVY